MVISRERQRIVLPVPALRLPERGQPDSLRQLPTEAQVMAQLQPCVDDTCRGCDCCDHSGDWDLPPTTSAGRIIFLCAAIVGGALVWGIVALVLGLLG